jgi:hypothetical protein
MDVVGRPLKPKELVKLVPSKMTSSLNPIRESRTIWYHSGFGIEY